jgi:hypothetical protein
VNYNCIRLLSAALLYEIKFAGAFLAAGCTMQNSKSYSLLFARLLMSSLFIWDGILQLRNPGSTEQYFASVHVPVPGVAIWISSAIHLLGGLARLFFLRHCKRKDRQNRRPLPSTCIVVLSCKRFSAS